MNARKTLSTGSICSKQALLVNALILLCLFFSGTSCMTTKSLAYFNNLSDSPVVHLPQLQKPLSVIMPDDLLEIKIAGANEATTALLNTYSSSIGATGNTAANDGYLVDDHGEIEFPILGKIKAAGLTKDQFKDLLKEKVSKYLKDPLVTVQFSNFRLTVLGEVKVAGSFLVPREKVTVLEALGLAGGMTSYGNRKNVRVLRDSSGSREVAMLDFTDKALFTSRYYYLQRNDVVYIETDKSKSQYEIFSRLSTIVATVTGLVAITIAILK